MDESREELNGDVDELKNSYFVFYYLIINTSIKTSSFGLIP